MRASERERPINLASRRVGYKDFSLYAHSPSVGERAGTNRAEMYLINLRSARLRALLSSPNEIKDGVAHARRFVRRERERERAMRHILLPYDDLYVIEARIAL